MLFRFSQPSKTYAFIMVTPLGILMFSSFVQYLKVQ